MTFEIANDNEQYTFENGRDYAAPEGHYLQLLAWPSLVGQTIKDVVRHAVGLRFTMASGSTIMITHEWECHETVELIDVCGDLDDLVGAPLLVAEARTTDTEIKEDSHYAAHYYSATATFIELATIKGSVTLRYYGASNGCYSETADPYSVEPFGDTGSGWYWSQTSKKWLKR